MRELLCGYCGAAAVDRIPATPEHVCRRDAEAFWRGVLVEAKLRRLAYDDVLPRDGWGANEKAA